MWQTKRVLGLGFLLTLTVIPAAAQQFDFAVDVPSDLGGIRYGANQIVRYFNGAYNLVYEGSSALGPAGHFSAIGEVSPGVYYVSVDAPTTITGTTYQPGDVIRFSGGVFSLQQSGAGLGLPANAKIDALGWDPLLGQLLLSLDVPVTLASTTYQPNDILELTGSTLSLFQSGSGLGIPAGVNVVGAGRFPTGELLAAFDVPVVLSGTQLKPGDIGVYDGNGWAQLYPSGDFPAGSTMTDFSLPGSPGTVPDGSAATSPLLAAKSASAGLLDLAWGLPCSVDVTGYSIYEGTLGIWYDHAALTCLTQRATTATVSPTPGNHYYLLVPTNGMYEGGFGSSSSGPIPPGTSYCEPRQIVSPCP